MRPYGRYFSVALAQAVVLASLQRSTLSRPPPLDSRFVSTLIPGTCFQFHYIYDHNSIDASAFGVSEATINISAVLSSLALSVAPEKSVFASGEVVIEGLGLRFWTNVVLTVRSG